MLQLHTVLMDPVYNCVQLCVQLCTTLCTTHSCACSLCHSHRVSLRGSLGGRTPEKLNQEVRGYVSLSQGVDIFLWHDFLDLLHPLFLPQITEIGLSRSNPWCSDCNGKCTQSQGPRVSACDNRDTWRLGLVGVPSPSLPLSLSATCDRKCVDHRQAAQLALGNQICATWTLEGVGLLGASKHQLQQRGGGPVMCFKGRWVRAGWRPTALALPLTFT